MYETFRTIYHDDFRNNIDAVMARVFENIFTLYTAIFLLFFEPCALSVPRPLPARVTTGNSGTSARISPRRCRTARTPSPSAVRRRRLPCVVTSCRRRRPRRRRRRPHVSSPVSRQSGSVARRRIIRQSVPRHSSSSSHAPRPQAY